MKVINLGKVVGADGRGIEKIEKTATNGLVDTYTITYTDKTVSMYDVINGKDGKDGENGSGTGGGLTTEQINALDGLFKIATYKENASSKYLAFRQAFGLEGGDEPTEPDTPDTPSGDWETVRILTTEDMENCGVSGNPVGTRTSYRKIDIPVEVGYTYRAETTFKYSKEASHGIVLWDKDLGMPTVGNFTGGTQYDIGWTNYDGNPLEVDVVYTNVKIKDITKNLCALVCYKYNDNSTMEADCITQVIISRKAISEELPETPSDWEIVRELTIEDMKVGSTVGNVPLANRTSYNNLDIPVEVGYTYQAITETKYSKPMYHGIVLWDMDLGEPERNTFDSLKQYDMGWTVLTNQAVKVDVVSTNTAIKDITKNLCILMAFKYNDDSNMETDCITKVTISRKKVS